MKFIRIALLLPLLYSSAALAEEFSLMAPGATPIRQNNVWGIAPPPRAARVPANAVEQVRVSLPPAAPDVMNRPRLVEAAVNPRDGSLDFTSAIPVQTIVEYGIPGVIVPETLAVDKISLKATPPVPVARATAQRIQIAPPAQPQPYQYQPQEIVPPAIMRQETALQNIAFSQKQEEIFNFAPPPVAKAPTVSYPDYKELARPEPVSLPIPAPTVKVETKQLPPPAPVQVPMDGISAADFFLSGSPSIASPSNAKMPANEPATPSASNKTAIKNSAPSLPLELLSSLPSVVESAPQITPPTPVNPEGVDMAPTPEAISAASRAVPPLTFPVTQEEKAEIAPPAPIALPVESPAAQKRSFSSDTFIPAPIQPAAKAPEVKEPMIKLKPSNNPLKKDKPGEPKFNMPNLSINSNKGALPPVVERPTEPQAKSPSFLSSFRKKDIAPPLTKKTRETPGKEVTTPTPSQSYGEDAYNPKEPPLPPGMYF